MMDAVDLFLRYLYSEKRFSSHTLVSYKTDLLQFSNFVSSSDPQESLVNVTSRHIRSWVICLLDEGFTARSVNRKITTLRRFYKFCQQESMVNANPAGSIPSVKAPKTLPVFIDETRMEQLQGGLECAEPHSVLRDQLILELLYGTGMRLSELAGLTDSSVDPVSLQVKVLGKRQKERIIPVTTELCQLVMTYQRERDRHFGILPTSALLVTDKGKPLYAKLIYRSVGKALTSVAVTGKVSPHVLRHTYATHMLNHGADLNAIKELLGHASLSATQVYTHTGFEKLKTVYRKAHPRA
jgi:integrase/recombinase XerC